MNLKSIKHEIKKIKAIRLPSKLTIKLARAKIIKFLRKFLY